MIDLDTPTIDLTAYDAAISGGIGNVMWYTDAASMSVIAMPATFKPTGDDVYAQVVSGSCVSSVLLVPIILELAFTPQPVCAYTSSDSVSITWENVAEAYDLSYQVNGQPTGIPMTTTDTAFYLGGLEQGDEIMLIITTSNNGVCNTPLTASIDCITESCPTAELLILYPDTICSEGDPFLLDVMINGLSGLPGITWSGIGVNADGRYDPSVAGAEPNTVTVTVIDGTCIYVDSVELTSVLTPVASFIIMGLPCADNTLELLFNGVAFFGASEWNWDFADADIMPHDRPVDFYLTWDHAGEYNLSLSIDHRGCLSDTFKYPISIGEIPDTFSVTCALQENNTVIVNWDSVAGAISFAGSSNEGVGVIEGTSYIVTGLEENTTVDIQIEAQGSFACGTTIATVQCQTPEYIVTADYIPNIFSPDGDGINDIMFVQTNSGIMEVTIFRIIDRWGNMVFEDRLFAPNDPAHGWDGTFKKKPLNPGVFLYLIEMKTTDGEVVRRSGDITLIRE